MVPNLFDEFRSQISAETIALWFFQESSNTKTCLTHVRVNFHCHLVEGDNYPEFDSNKQLVIHSVWDID